MVLPDIAETRMEMDLVTLEDYEYSYVFHLASEIIKTLEESGRKPRDKKAALTIVQAVVELEDDRWTLRK